MITVSCNERSGVVERTVKPFHISGQNVRRFYEEASPFPVLFGKEVTTLEDFLSYFVSYSEPSGDPILNGLFWEVDDLTGMFYLTDITPTDANAHFAFFDQQIRGREPLVREMIRHVFKRYHFQRLSASAPKFTGRALHDFILRCGFRLEGVKRGAAPYRGKWFDVPLYGILRHEALPEEYSDGSAT